MVLAYHASGCMQYEAALPWDAEMQPLSGVPCGCACVLRSELANHGWLAEHVSATAVISGVPVQKPPALHPIARQLRLAPAAPTCSCSSAPADAIPEFNIFGLQRLFNDLGGIRCKPCPSALPAPALS